MKKYYPFLSLSLFFFTGTAQTVNIPDENFKNKLLNYTPTIDINGDGEIQVNESLSVFELYLNDLNISDLTGIEAFANLNFLSCSNNNLTSLAINNLTNLTTLACGINNLSSLDVSNLSQLSYLGCYYNSIADLDITNLPNLIWLECSSNQLTELDLSNATKLYRVNANDNLFTTLDFSHFVPTSENPVTTYHLSNNPNLTSVNIKNGAPLINMQPGFLIYPFASENCPNLTDICADDFNLERLIAYTQSNPNIQFNTNCPLLHLNDEFEDKAVSIFPNPVKDQLHITSQHIITSIQLYDVLGRLCETNVFNENSIIFNIGRNARGIYFVTIYTENGVNVEKVIKE